MNMLRVSLFFCTLLIFASQGSGHCVWQLFSKDARGSSYFLDSESIVRTDGKVKVDMKRTLPEKNEKYKLFLEKLEIDCGARSYRTLEKKLHRKDNVIEQEPAKNIMKSIIKGTPVDQLWEALCK